jgi:hypothetical protein
MPKVLTLDGVRELLSRKSRWAAWRWLRANKIPNRSPSPREWLVFESDVLAKLLRPGETLPVEPVDHRQEGKDDFDKHFPAEASWSKH